MLSSHLSHNRRQLQLAENCCWNTVTERLTSDMDVRLAIDLRCYAILMTAVELAIRGAVGRPPDTARCRNDSLFAKFVCNGSPPAIRLHMAYSTAGLASELKCFIVPCRCRFQGPSMAELQVMWTSVWVTRAGSFSWRYQSMIAAGFSNLVAAAKQFQRR